MSRHAHSPSWPKSAFSRSKPGKLRAVSIVIGCAFGGGLRTNAQVVRSRFLIQHGAIYLRVSESVTTPASLARVACCIVSLASD
jgi:hypothetical protein